MLAFVTIGSTRFDALITSVFAEPFLSALLRKGYTHLIVQCGNSDFEQSSLIKNGETRSLSKAGVEIEFWKFRPSLEDIFQKADLVIGHSGSGTILDVLRKGKMMIVVPNATLLDNHQEELAVTLEVMGHLKAATVENLPKIVEDFDASSIKPFPPFDGSRFARIVDEEMGFI